MQLHNDTYLQSWVGGRSFKRTRAQKSLRQNGKGHTIFARVLKSTTLPPRAMSGAPDSRNPCPAAKPGLNDGSEDRSRPDLCSVRRDLPRSDDPPTRAGGKDHCRPWEFLHPRHHTQIVNRLLNRRTSLTASPVVSRPPHKAMDHRVFQAGGKSTCRLPTSLPESSFSRLARSLPRWSLGPCPSAGLLSATCGPPSEVGCRRRMDPRRWDKHQL